MNQLTNMGSRPLWVSRQRLIIAPNQVVMLPKQTGSCAFFASFLAFNSSHSNKRSTSLYGRKLLVAREPKIHTITGVFFPKVHRIEFSRRAMTSEDKPNSFLPKSQLLTLR